MAKDRLDSDFWGLRVITKERVSDGRRNDLAYGVVVTLHEINGVNRIDEFESACLANGWLVNRVNVTDSSLMKSGNRSLSLLVHLV